MRISAQLKVCYIGFLEEYTWVSLLEQELLTLPEHLSSVPVFSGAGVT
jgi:hypothetical protein